jgi:hypothetical protein
MGLLSWLTGTRPTEATDEPPTPSGAGERGDIFSRLINVPSRNFAGISSQSPNKRFTIAWLDGGPDQSRTGRYLLLDGRSVVAEGKLPRPNDGLVTHLNLISARPSFDVCQWTSMLRPCCVELPTNLGSA